jgi:hypothetical protein
MSKIEIGPSLIGHPDLYWFPLGQFDEVSGTPPEAIALIQRRTDGTPSGAPRPAIVLRLEEFKTKKQLLRAMKQAENDFLFGTNDVGTMTID